MSISSDIKKKGAQFIEPSYPGNSEITNVDRKRSLSQQIAENSLKKSNTSSTSSAESSTILTTSASAPVHPVNRFRGWYSQTKKKNLTVKKLENLISGSFGELSKIIFIDTDNPTKEYPVVFKKNKTENTEVKTTEDIKHLNLLKEAKILHALNRLYEETTSPFVRSFGCISLMSENKSYLFLEFCQQDLFEYQQALPEKLLPLRQIKIISRQLIMGLQALSELNPPILHADIKPENVLIRSFGSETKNFQVCLCDFGSAVNVPYIMNKDSSYFGTRNYMPPEMIFKQGLTTASDIWSFGVLLYSFISNEDFFPAEKFNKKNLKNPQFLPAEMARLIGEIPKDYIEYLDLSKNKFIESPTNPNMVYLKKDSIPHPTLLHSKLEESFSLHTDVFSGLYSDTGQENEEIFQDLLKRILVFNPEERISYRRMIEHPFFS